MSCFMVEPKTIIHAVYPLYKCAWDRHPYYGLNRHLSGLSVTDKDGVLHPMDLTRIDHRESLYDRMHLANAHAYFARYGEAVDAYPIGEGGIFCQNNDKMPTDIQAYKALQCWVYQCTESGIPAHSADLVNRMKIVLADLARIIVESMPEYELAKWGE